VHAIHANRLAQPPGEESAESAEPEDPAVSEGGHATDPLGLAEELEAWLGDPDLESNAVSFVRGLEYDEMDELPSAGIERLRAFGFHRYFVPARLGGALRGAQDLLMLSRVVARRDMNVAVSESTQLWMMLAWIGGDDAQQAAHAATMLRGGVIPCLAYSELAHGADLAANELRAEPHEGGPGGRGEPGGYVLTGEKFPINRGRTSTHVVLLGDTGGEQTPDRRRQSLFLVERAEVESGKVYGLPRVPTYGLRGCDISGIGFDGARVDPFARLGAQGEGLELALRGLLITRTFCTGLSLGTGDTMLRTVAGFLGRRRLYDGPASEIPYVTETLANAYVSLLVAECESLVAMRGLHLHIDEFSLWANLAKVQVARLIDGNAEALARALGARYFMRAPEHAGIFQKMLRDSAIVSVFDGSEPVCLDSIAVQLGALAKASRLGRDEDWSLLYDLRQPLPAFEPANVTVFGRGRDAVFASLPGLLELLEKAAPDEGCDQQRLSVLRELGARLATELKELLAQTAEARSWAAAQAAQPSASAKTTSPRLLGLAERACALHAKVSALGVWLHNRGHLGAFFADGEWLQVALARERVHRYEVGDLEPATARRVFTRLNEQLAAHEFFSVTSVRQARPGAAEPGAGHRVRAAR
jgi:alkylation response protein AidB-like acyl-CoA dehydrogenase